MKKRPLSMVCICLVIVIWGLRAVGDETLRQIALDIPDKYFLDTAYVSGQIYDYELTKTNLILYLKKTILSDIQNYELNIRNIKIYALPEQASEFQISDWVTVCGKLQVPDEASNPGQFDSFSYYNTKKIDYLMWEPEIQLDERPRLSLKRTLRKIRSQLIACVDNMSNQSVKNVLKAMMFGDKSKLEDSVKIDYQNGGISHVLAISSLHLNILGMTLYRLLRRMGFPLKGAGIISGAFLACYGVMTGAGIATMRALILYFFRIGGDLTGRTYDVVTGLALAAVILLANNPSYLGSSGFWLSFTAVMSFRIFQDRKAWISGILLNTFMAPVLLYYYYKLPLYSPVLNLLVVPSMSIVLLCGFVSCLVGMLVPGLGAIILWPALWILRLYGLLCKAVGQLPVAVLILGRPKPWQIAVYYGIMLLTLFLYRKFRLYKVRFAYLLIMIPTGFILSLKNHSKLQITMLDVGQGDGIVVHTPSDNHYLIDGGSSSVKSVGKNRIIPYLEYSGVRKLTGVFVSHTDEDHMNGITELLERISTGECFVQIEKLVLPDWKDKSEFEDMIKLANESKIAVEYMGMGSQFADGEVKVKCLFPDGKDYSDKKNEGSMTLLMRYREFDALFTGDLEGEGEKQVIDKLMNIDLLKAAHHGSRNSTGNEFLEAANPEIALISSSSTNTYGHPHQETLDRLELIRCDVWCTKDVGAITVRTDGKKVWVEGMLEE